MEIADAFVVAGIEVGNLANAHFGGGFAHRVKNGPRQPRRLDPPAAADTVMLARPKKMIFQSLERRQHIVIAPPR